MSFYEFLRSAPYIRLVLPFACGILGGQYIRVHDYILFIICLVLSSFLFFVHLKFGKSFKYKWLWGFVFTMSAICWGIFAVNFSGNTEKISENRIIAVGTVVENPVVKLSGFKVMLQLEAMKEAGNWHSAKNKILYTFQKRNNLPGIQLNDRVIIRGTISEIRNFGNPFEFDYKTYMNRKGIYLKAFVDSGNWHVLGQNNSINIRVIALKLRNKILKYYQQLQLSTSTFAIISALTVGDTSFLDDELRSVYSSSGTMHILAVSGMHVGLLYLLLQQILRPLLLWRRGKILSIGIILAVIWIYALITGLTPSVVRATVMFSFVLLGDAGNRKVNIYNTLAASSLLILLIHPQTLFDVGFQLSYIAVIGIVIFYQDIYKIIYIPNKLLNYFWEIVSISIAAQLLTLPLSLYYFHQFPNYFLISNIIALPLSSLILYSSIAALLVIPFKAFWVYAGWVLNLLVDLLNKVLAWIEHLPHSVTYGLSISGSMAIALTIGIFAFRYYSYRKKAIGIVLVFVCGIYFTTDILFKRIYTSHSKEIVVYNTPGNLNLHFRSGFESFLVSNGEIANSMKVIKAYNDFYHLDSVSFINLENAPSIQNEHLALYKGFVLYENKKIYIWNKKPDFNKQASVDLLVIDKISKNDIVNVTKYFKPGVVVITSQVYKNISVALKKHLISNNIQCRLLAMEGAWIGAEEKKMIK